jgi:predicted nucleic acid-binding protein
MVPMTPDPVPMVLAAQAAALLVTGDADLLGLGVELPIHTPRSFVALLHV